MCVHLPVLLCRKQLPVQRMLDFDYLCGRATPSVAAIVQPGASGFQKLFFGREEIAIPMASQPSRLRWALTAVSYLFRVLSTHASQVAPVPPSIFSLLLQSLPSSSHSSFYRLAGGQPGRGLRSAPQGRRGGELRLVPQVRRNSAPATALPRHAGKPRCISAHALKQLCSMYSVIRCFFKQAMLPTGAGFPFTLPYTLTPPHPSSNPPHRRPPSQCL
jgi:hypothetical protein